MTGGGPRRRSRPRNLGKAAGRGLGVWVGGVEGSRRMVGKNWGQIRVRIDEFSGGKGGGWAQPRFLQIFSPTQTELRSDFRVSLLACAVIGGGNSPPGADHRITLGRRGWGYRT